jgi:hypothetical protein
MSKQIFSKIAKIGEEVRSAEAIKVDLAITDDVNQAAYLLDGYANDMRLLKKSMQEDMRRLEGIQGDGIEMFRSLSSLQNELKSKFKEIGLDAAQSPQFKAAEKALTLWADANSMKI